MSGLERSSRELGSVRKDRMKQSNWSLALWMEPSCLVLDELRNSMSEDCDAVVGTFLTEDSTHEMFPCFATDL